jgi:hypothetical protein
MGQALNGERNPKLSYCFILYFLHSSNRCRSRSRRDSCGTVVVEVAVMEEEGVVLRRDLVLYPSKEKEKSTVTWCTLRSQLTPTVSTALKPTSEPIKLVTRLQVLRFFVHAR